MVSFETIRSHVEGKYKITAREPYLVCVELSLDNGKRHQSLFYRNWNQKIGINICA
jgi:hypothetical protein